MTQSLHKFALACLMAAPLAVFAADEAPPPATAPMAQQHDEDMGAEMMKGKRCKDGQRCEEMKGKRCDMEKMEHGMMGRGPHMPGGMVMIPRLPPGNEKAQLQMEAEIHQKLGEILSKYAAQLK